MRQWFPHAKRVHFIHTSPVIEHLKSLDNASDKADAERNKELEYALGAIVFAVGPRLTRQWTDEFGEQLQIVNTFNPGFSEPMARKRPTQKQLLMMGRLDKGNLKGVDIAVSAILKLRPPVERFILRGTPQDASEAAEQQKLEATYQGQGLPLLVKRYNPSVAVIHKDLQEASLLLMPSREEGFGLVGWEAIQKGTPVLISSNSGLADLLKQYHCYGPIVDVTWGATLNENAEVWSKKIAENLSNYEQCFQGVFAVAQTMARELPWSKVIADFLLTVQNPPSAQS
mmetsp:Transcript_5810/g.8134  ORF Transcript_5810/g.8134 Transcript_5810/m.8134 type:complete len:285 (+) Transcript_5810:1889-2743(+)